MRDFCNDLYTDLFNERFNTLHNNFVNRNHREPAPSGLDEMEKDAQRHAIHMATIQSASKFHVEPAEIWHCIRQSHVSNNVYRTVGKRVTQEVIDSAISGEQSWKSSSGHAFEEIVADFGTSALRSSGIRIVLQRDFGNLLHQNGLDNEQDDINWLNAQVADDSFDDYAIIEKNNKTFCFGCIQCKTSIRDRVSRDRELSSHAMGQLFWSATVVFDGKFLKKKNKAKKENSFVAMVNGGSNKFPTNGWHGMYVLSNAITSGRIYPTNFDMMNFKEHAIQAAKTWLSKREELNADWKAN